MLLAEVLLDAACEQRAATSSNGRCSSSSSASTATETSLRRRSIKRQPNPERRFALVRKRGGGGNRTRAKVPAASHVARDEGADVLHQQHQVQRISGRLLEPVLLVPGLRPFMLRVDEEDSNTDRVSGIHAPKQDVLQK